MYFEKPEKRLLIKSQIRARNVLHVGSRVRKLN